MDSQLSRLQSALVDRYAIERELGRGGMATVYLARDLKHDRAVAIKVLHPEVFAALGLERFLQEIRLAARLQHPHILAVHDSGNADGTPYYVMPYVAGETLRRRLDREQQLPLEDTLRLTREVAEALDYAHRQGVVHRDIKPENILLAEGQAVVADFGIAHAITAAADERLTATGIVIGTPLYMSPEQARGATPIDGRSDLYSLGCVAYEMLAGHAPFLGVTQQEIIARHTLDPVPPLRAARPSAPEHVQAALVTALAKVPADRFRSCTDFASALATEAPSQRSPSAGRYRASLRAAGVIALLGGVAWIATRVFRPGDEPKRSISVPQSIVVLPFTNASGSPESDYLSDGITEDLINELARFPELRVVARTSAFAFKSRPADARTIGTELRVQNLVEGSVRRLGDTLRIAVQLIEAANGLSSWSTNYSRPATALLVLEADLARGIEHALNVESPTASTTQARPAPNVEAYTAYLKGRFHFNQWQIADEREALAYFNDAIALDPTFAAAYSGLADAYYSLSGRFLPPAEAIPRARAAARKAIELDSSLAEAYVSLADIEGFADWDWPAAERSLQRALALRPDYAIAHHHYGMLLCYERRFDRATGELNRAQQLDPLSPSIEATAVWPLYLGHRYDEAITALERLLTADTSYFDAHSLLGTMHLLKHDYTAAIRELHIYLAHEYTPYYSATLALAYSGSGRNRDARMILDSLRARSDPEVPYSLAVLYAGLGQPDRAMDWLEQTYRAHNEDILWAKVDPLLDGLRDLPRFHELLSKLPGD